MFVSWTICFVSLNKIIMNESTRIRIEYRLVLKIDSNGILRFVVWCDPWVCCPSVCICLVLSELCSLRIVLLFIWFLFSVCLAACLLVAHTKTITIHHLEAVCNCVSMFSCYLDRWLFRFSAYHSHTAIVSKFKWKINFKLKSRKRKKNTDK